MLEVLRQIVKASRERRELSEWVRRELSLPSGAVVHVREVQSQESAETVITVIEAETIRKYLIAKAAADITQADLRMLSTAPVLTTVHAEPNLS